MAEDLPTVGDIITSRLFAYGYYQRDSNKKLIIVDGTTTSHPETSHIDEDERVSIAARTGEIPLKTRTVELGAYDPSRAEAKFVIEAAKMQGGGTGHGPGDVFPDGWNVKARRLNNEGKYDPNGEVIEFYMSGSFTNKIDPKDVQVVGKMRMQIQFN